MIVAIDGNIGSGKSTLLALIRAGISPSVASVHPEPVDQWRDILKAYYEDSRANAFRLSCTILLSFCEALHSAPPAQVRVFERCPEASLNVFASMNRADGDISAREWDVLTNMHADLAWKPDLVLFVDTPSHICCDRVAARARACEETMSTQYVRRVEHHYKKWLDGLPKGRVIVIDGARPPQEVAEDACMAIADTLAARKGVPPPPRPPPRAL